MNLVQQAERLKYIPDQELVRMQQQPTMVPPYLVVAEMQRRAMMRKAATAGQDPIQQRTVAQEMSQQLAGMMPQQGAGAMPQQEQQAPEPGRMAGGGVMRAQGGMQVSGSGPLSMFDYTNPNLGQMAVPVPVPVPARRPATIPTYGMTMDPSQFVSNVDPSVELATLRKMRGENPLAKVAEQLAAEEQRTRGQKQGIGEILMRLGLGMAASRRPDALGAIGEGGLSALQGYIQNRDIARQQADQMQQRRLGLLERIQGSEDVLMREAGDLARAKAYEKTANAQTIEANRRAMAQQYGENLRAEERRVFELQKQQIEIAANTARDQAKGQDELDKIDRQEKKAINELREEYRLGSNRFRRDTGGGGERTTSQLNSLNNAIKLETDQLNDLYKQQSETSDNAILKQIDREIRNSRVRIENMRAGWVSIATNAGLIPELPYTPPPGGGPGTDNPKGELPKTPPANATPQPKRPLTEPEIAAIKAMNPVLSREQIVSMHSGQSPQPNTWRNLVDFVNAAGKAGVGVGSRRGNQVYFVQ